MASPDTQMTIRCWLFGHKWTHWRTWMTGMASSLCDRCGYEGFR